MTDDIVDNLRKSKWNENHDTNVALCEDAADEIERLRVELDHWQHIAKILGDGYSLTDEIRPALQEVYIKFYANSPAVMDAV